MDVVISLSLALLGLCMGSFCLALVWRIRKSKDFIKGRSECEHCHHVLGPLDLIPLASWLVLKGKCRYCRKPIGWEFPLIEIAMAALFLGSYFLWPYEINNPLAILQFMSWLIILVGLVALFIYDVRWMLLPDVITYPLIITGIAYAGVMQLQQPEPTFIKFITEATLGMAAIAGTYWVLYLATKGRGVGFGDVKLSITIGIVLGWKGAFLTLFLSNVLGLIFVLPRLIRGTLSAKSAVPFGPFLITAFIVTVFFGNAIIDSYMKAVLM